MDYLIGFLVLDIGVAIGIAISAFLIAIGGCYEGCKLRGEK